MYSSIANPYRITFVVVLAISLAAERHAAGQPLSPLGNPASADPIAEVYNLTKTASKYDDFLAISTRCQTLLAGDPSEKDREYLHSLLGWAENRLAGKELANANGLKSVGLHEQSALELKKAIHRYDKLIQSHPQLWRPWMGRAVIHAGAGEYQAALEKFRKVLQLDVKNNNARFNCAEILYAQKDYQKAITEYSKVLIDDAADVQALTGRGHCYAKLKQFSKACEDFLTVTKLQPDDAQAEENFKVATHRLAAESRNEPAGTLTSSPQSADQRH